MANSYTPFYPGGWKNFPDQSTPINAEALQNIEQGLQNAESDIKRLELSVGSHAQAITQLDNRVGAVEEAQGSYEDRLQTDEARITQNAQDVSALNQQFNDFSTVEDVTSFFVPASHRINEPWEFGAYKCGNVVTLSATFSFIGNRIYSTIFTISREDLKPVIPVINFNISERNESGDPSYNSKILSCYLEKAGGEIVARQSPTTGINYALTITYICSN